MVGDAAKALFQSMPLDHLPPATTILTAAARMPFARNGQFVGRERELMTLALAIADPAPTVMVSAVAAGLGGIGKTSMAVEFVYRYARYFAGGVFWLNCADPAMIPSEVAACAPALGLPVAGLVLDDQVVAVRRAWLDDLPRLVIFDNCEDPALLEQWRPPHGGSRVLVTARRGNWPKTLYRVALGVLDRADSIALLTQLCPRLTPAEADGLAEDLGDLPLALHLAGCYLTTYDHTSVDVYRAQLSLDHDSLKGRGTESLPTRHERDVARTFALSYDQLDPANPIDDLARWLLACAAQLAPGVPIPRDLLLAMVPEETPQEDAIDALARLRGLGLLDGEGLMLHRLLAGFVRQQPDVPGAQGIVDRAVGAQAVRINTTKRPAAMTPLLPHLWVVAQAADKRAGSQAATLLFSLGYYLYVTGDYAGARPLYERALTIREAVLGPDHPDTAISLESLAELLRVTGNQDEAKPLFERAVAINEALFGSDHPNTARSLNLLAVLLRGTGDYVNARVLHERALAIREAVLGSDHLETALSLKNLAGCFREMENYQAAKPLYLRALAIREAKLGLEHVDTAMSLYNLAYALYHLGDYRAAQALYERALVIMEPILGPHHPDIATVLNDLATLLQTIEDAAGAKPLLERALAIRETVLRPGHPRIQVTRNSLAACLSTLDQFTPEGLASQSGPGDNP